MRILIADEESRVRSAIRLFLEQQPEANVVEEVSSIQEMMCYVRNCHLDILLLDWRLAGPEPEKVFAGLRLLCSKIVTIVLDSEPQIKQTALESGANDFVGKNEPPERLLAAIEGSRSSENNPQR